MPKLTGLKRKDKSAVDWSYFFNYFNPIQISVITAILAVIIMPLEY
jgi:hypothetical protein